jgi:glutamyl-Q tRNA(Asp) synthetase
MAAEITRFAPSPTGELHLGHALAARVAWDEAQRSGGTFLLRWEDIDTTRCREEYVAKTEEDLRWLGLNWPQPAWRQSGRMAHYAAALDRLRGMDLLYPCFCTRQEIAAAASAPQGPEGPVYPGTCRHLTASVRREKMESGTAYAWRLDSAQASATAGPLEWHDRRHGIFQVDLTPVGDVVLARKDVPVSYHLAVTVDDAAQGVTLVTRGLDLLPATHIHRLLQSLLDLPVPEWRHHGLVLDETGRRLAKRDAARSLRFLRESGGWSPKDVWRAVAGYDDA